MLKSLQGRILFLATITLAIFTGLTGLVLQKAFLYSLEEGSKERLQARLYGLLATADSEQGMLILPTALQEERFNQLNSGLYAYVSDKSGQLIWRSMSSLNLRLALPRRLEPGQRQYSHMVSGNFKEERVTSQDERVQFKPEPLHSLSMGVVWEFSGGIEKGYTFTLVESKRPYLAKLEGFKKTIRNGLWGGAAVLIILQYIILRWGLAPIKNIALGIRKIERGESESIEGHYPRELELVARNINLLVGNERRQRERYRNTMTDLAHSLKTPLAVMRNALSQTRDFKEFSGLADEQLERMNQIISHQLQRSVFSAPANVMNGCNLRRVVTSLLSALHKVYREKEIEQLSEIDDELNFFGDEADLMEMLGNILDNAYKHSVSKVKFSAKEQDINGRLSLLMSIEDDGSGVPESVRESVLQRGFRADSRLKGQGIGLAVATDICSSYQGKIDISNSSLGGAKFTLMLPVRMSSKSV